MFKSKILFADTSVLNKPQIDISELNFSVKAPAGWKIRQHYRGKTLVFEDPLATNSKGVMYNRNITIAVQNEVRPIDGLEVQHLSQKLIQEFGRDVSDFDIIEARVIDYRSKGDAILVFSTFTQVQVPMRQMHIFTSASSNSVLLTYTDLQDSFEAEGAMDKVWGSMMSAELSGEAPRRYDGLMYSLSGMTFVGSAAFLSKQLRRRQSKAALRDAEDSLFEDDEEYEVEKRAVTEPWQIAETRFAEQIA